MFRVWKWLTKLSGFYYKNLESIATAYKTLQYPKGVKVRLSSQDLKKYRKRWRPLSPVISEVWFKKHFIYTGKIDYNVIPENIYYTVVEPLLNDQQYSRIWEDKSMIDWFHGNNFTPATFLRNLHGVYYSADKVQIGADVAFPSGMFGECRKVIAKKSLGVHGGRSVEVFEWIDNAYFNAAGVRLSLEYLEERFKNNFVVQEYIVQHPSLAKLNPSSVNSVRINTYRSVVDNQVYVVSAELKVGAVGSVVDNIKQGGSYFAIAKDGQILDIGIDSRGRIVHEVGVPPVKTKELGEMIKFDEICKASIEIASAHLYSRVLGLDITVDDQERVRLIEVNNFDIGCTGEVAGPMFGEFTDEVIDYCIKKKGKRHLCQLYKY